MQEEPKSKVNIQPPVCNVIPNRSPNIFGNNGLEYNQHPTTTANSEKSEFSRSPSWRQASSNYDTQQEYLEEPENQQPPRPARYTIQNTQNVRNIVLFYRKTFRNLLIEQI